MGNLARWAEIFRELGLNPDPEVHAELRRRHSEPSRAYHTLHHVAECLRIFTTQQAQAQRPQELELAIWFHDAILDVRRSDNELRSAEWARRALHRAGADAALAQRVHDLVVATAPHAEVAAGDACVLVDIDLAIYGARPSRYDEYERQLRQEHRHVPQSLYRAVRRKTLSDLLAAPQLYLTASFREQYQSQAQVNIQRSLRQLGGSGLPARGPDR
jgi:predicted metal-dependent HD superfamily phosphohydrolase